MRRTSGSVLEGMSTFSMDSRCVAMACFNSRPAPEAQQSMRSGSVLVGRRHCRNLLVKRLAGALEPCIRLGCRIAMLEDRKLPIGVLHTPMLKGLLESYHRLRRHKRMR